MEHTITALEMISTNALSFILGGIIIGFIVYFNSAKVKAKVDQLEASASKEIGKIKMEVMQAETKVKTSITEEEQKILDLYRTGQAKIVGFDNKLLHDFKNP